MRLCALALVAPLAGACGGAASGGASASPTPAPTALGQAALKYRLVEQFGRPLFCDPDFYPIARADEQQLAHQGFPEIQKDVETFAAIVTSLGLQPAGPYSAQDELAIYRDWTMLNALKLGPALIGFRFSMHVTAPRASQKT